MPGPCIATSDATVANAALTGDKRLLFSDSGDTFIMYQIAGHSWIALGDPVGARAGAEELVWRLREMSDHHGGAPVFYQVGAERLSLYVDLGLAAMKIGEEARVPLVDFSLDGAARAELRQAHRRAQRDSATFEVVEPAGVDALLPVMERISDAWLAAKSTGEKRFSVGAFSPDYLRQFPVAIVRAAGVPAAFANLWTTGTREELSVDLMRFEPRCTAQRDGLSFHRADAVGPARGLSLVQSRHGAACRAWNRIRSHRPGTVSATSSSATASISIISTACAATRRSSRPGGSRVISWPAAALPCRACWWTCRY